MSKFGYGDGSFYRQATRRERSNYKSPEEVESDRQENSKIKAVAFTQMIKLANDCQRELYKFAQFAQLYEVNKPLTNVCVSLGEFISKMVIARTAQGGKCEPPDDDV